MAVLGQGPEVKAEGEGGPQPPGRGSAGQAHLARSSGGKWLDDGDARCDDPRLAVPQGLPRQARTSSRVALAFPALAVRRPGRVCAQDSQGGAEGLGPGAAVHLCRQSAVSGTAAPGGGGARPGCSGPQPPTGAPLTSGARGRSPRTRLNRPASTDPPLPYRPPLPTSSTARRSASQAGGRRP